MAPWLNRPVEPSWHCWLQADLAGRDFAAERDQAVVVSTGAAVSDLDRERSAEARAVAEVRLPPVELLPKPGTLIQLPHKLWLAEASNQHCRH